MTPVYDIIEHHSDKVDNANTDTSYPIYNPKIQMDDGSFVDPYEWQTELLKRIRNLSILINSDSCSFESPVVQGGFYYNALYLQGDVFLLNITTRKVRKFLYEKEPINN